MPMFGGGFPVANRTIANRLCGLVWDVEISAEWKPRSNPNLKFNH